jgi:aerobic carbon-monoxide dehydrogenase large subunit
MSIDHLAPRFVGQSITRKEDRRFLTGAGKFIDDHVLPGMLHAAFVRSPLARAKINSIDTKAALALPGVYAVLVEKDIAPLVGRLTGVLNGREGIGVDQMLSSIEASYVGDPIVLVVAEDRYIAEDAAELVQIDFDPLDPVITPVQAKEAKPCLPGFDTNVNLSFDTSTPEIERIFAEAALIVHKTISQARVVPAPMETRGLLVHAPAPDQLELYLSSQNPHQARRHLSEMLALHEHQIRVVSPDVGGGFGQKYHLHRDEMAVIGAARLLRRPIKWIEDRTEALIAGGHARMEAVGLELAFDKEGLILASRLSYEDTCGADPLIASGILANLMLMFHTGPYKIPKSAGRVTSYFTNTGGNVSYRGPWAGESLIRETTMDEAARRLKIDPTELRRRNLITRADQPYILPKGIAINGVTPFETLEQALSILDYKTFREEQTRLRAQGRFIGLGTSVYIEPCAISGGSSSTDLAEVRIELGGKIQAWVTCHSQGHSIETTIAQVIADELGVEPTDVNVRFGDTDAVGYGSGAGGSRQAVAGGGAAKIAASILRDKVLKIAGHLLQTPVEDLRLERGEIRSGGATPRSVRLAEIGQAAYHNPSSLPEGMEPGLEARFRYTPPPFSFSNATHLCVAEVDITTGLVKLKRWIVSEDCGVMLNPAVVEGQISGGVVQGIGGVLWEHQPYDEFGNPGASTLKDYMMPLAADIPIIEFGHHCTPSPTPTGAKGVGEGGAIVAPAAVYNAVMDALAPFNVSLDALPLTPSRLLAAIELGRTSR